MSPILDKIDRLSRWPRGWLVALLATSILVVAAADYLSGERYTVYVLYFPIVALGCWLLGLRAAILLSFFSSILWIADDVFSPPQPIPYLAKYWQALTRFLVFVSFAYVLAKLRVALARERYRTQFDELTGLPNRAALFEFGQRDLARCRRMGRPLTAIFLDLDHFKEVNDRYGHAQGDRVLQAVARTIRDCTRDTDLPARIGGDEFVIVLPEMDYECAEQYIQRLHQQLRQTAQSENWPVTFSIGAATFNSLPPALDEIVKTADDLMYVVKRRQKNAVKHCLIDEIDHERLPELELQSAAH